VVQNLLINVNYLVQLGYRHHVKVLMKEEQFHLMEVYRVLDALHQNKEHFFAKVHCWLQVEGVDDQTYLERVGSDADNE